MEIVNISREVFDEIMLKSQSFRDKVLALCQKYKSKGLDEWLDNQDVCLRLNISPRTLQSYRDNGKIGFSRINNKIYYALSDVEKLLQSDTEIENENINITKLKEQ